VHNRPVTHSIKKHAAGFTHVVAAQPNPLKIWKIKRCRLTCAIERDGDAAVPTHEVVKPHFGLTWRIELIHNLHVRRFINARLSNNNDRR
jgi:hypothetical protein